MRLDGVKEVNQRAVLTVFYDRAFDDRGRLFRRNYLLVRALLPIGIQPAEPIVVAAHRERKTDDFMKARCDAVR